MTFEVHERFLVRRDWDRVYEPGEERIVITHSNRHNELEARRSLINRNSAVGIQTLRITKLED